MDWNKLTMVLTVVGFVLSIAVALYQLSGGKQHRKAALLFLAVAVTFLAGAYAVISPSTHPQTSGQNDIDDLKRQNRELMSLVANLVNRETSKQVVKERIVPSGSAHVRARTEGIPMKLADPVQISAVDHSGLKLQITADEKAWVTARRDDESNFAYLWSLQPGETRSLEAKDHVRLLTKNAGALRMKINGRLAEAIGSRGQTREAVISERGVDVLAEPTPQMCGYPLVGPMPISSVQAEYSELAKAAKFQGSVTLEFVVGVSGEAENIHVHRGLGFGLDENAIAALRRWRFKPAMNYCGPAISQLVSAEFEFRLI